MVIVKLRKMKQTIEINVPNGYKAKWNEETKQIDLIKICPKSWDEYCKNLDNDEYDVNISCPRSIGSDIDAFIKLYQLHKAWVGDKRKISYYSIYWDYVSDEIRTSNNFHHLWFPTEEMAEEFIECFKDLIEKAKRFI